MTEETIPATPAATEVPAAEVPATPEQPMYQPIGRHEPLPDPETSFEDQFAETFLARPARAAFFAEPDWEI